MLILSRVNTMQWLRHNGVVYVRHISVLVCQWLPIPRVALAHKGHQEESTVFAQNYAFDPLCSPLYEVLSFQVTAGKQTQATTVIVHLCRVIFRVPIIMSLQPKYIPVMINQVWYKKLDRLLSWKVPDSWCIVSLACGGQELWKCL